MRLINHEKLVTLERFLQRNFHCKILECIGGEFLGIKTVSIAPGFFCRVHRGVSMPDQFIDIKTVLGKYTDTDTDADLELVGIQGKRIAESVQYFICNNRQLTRVIETFNDQGKLIAAEACQRI